MVRETSLEEVTLLEEKNHASRRVAAGAVTADERQRRHGHKPGILLLGKRAPLAKSLDRALFDDGFQTVVLDALGVVSPALKRLLVSLYGAGLIVLCTNASLEPQDLAELPSTVVFQADDLESLPIADPQTNDAQIAQRALSFAKKLRFSPDSKPAKRGS